MTIIICSGIHSPNLTLDFIGGVGTTGINPDDVSIVPIDYNPPFFPFVGALWLQDTFPKNVPITMIGFSAGVVGAIVAANLWRFRGGRIAKFIAVDGWGMPLTGDFPIYRLSHDYFTHWSSLLLGGGEINFYARPGCSHLDLWQFPGDAKGWRVAPGGKTYTNAAAFLRELLSES